MISYIVIDDEMHARERIINVINKRHGWHLVGEAAAFDDAKTLLLNQQPNVCFVDVNIIGGDGLTLINQLKHKFVCKWIIMSAYSDYAIKGYEIEVENYLLKPIDNIRLEKALLRIETYYADKMFYQEIDINKVPLTGW